MVPGIHPNDPDYRVEVTNLMEGSWGLENFEEMADFIIDLFIRGDGLGDDGAQGAAEALAQPMCGHLHRAFAHAVARGDFRVGRGGAVERDESFQILEQGKLAALAFACFDQRERAGQLAERPLPREFHVRRDPVGWFPAQLSFDGFDVQGQQRDPAAAFGRRGKFVPVDHIPRDRLEQERAQPAVLGSHMAEGIPFEEFREKSLGEILRIRRAISLAADKGINRRPIGLAQATERRVCSRAIAACGADHCP